MSKGVFGRWQGGAEPPTGRLNWTGETRDGAEMLEGRRFQFGIGMDEEASAQWLRREIGVIETRILLHQAEVEGLISMRERMLETVRRIEKELEEECASSEEGTD